MKFPKLLLLMIPLIVLIVWLAPFVLIWSLNTLFHLSIGYTLSTWAAALVLGAVVSAGSAKK